MAPLNLRHQARYVDIRHGDRAWSRFGIEPHRVALHPAENALQPPGVVDGLAQGQAHLFAGEAGEVGSFFQRPVEPGRGDFESVVVDLLGREKMGQMRAYPRTVLDVDATGLVDEHAHQSAGGRVVAIDQFVAQ